MGDGFQRDMIWKAVQQGVEDALRGCECELDPVTLRPASADLEAQGLQESFGDGAVDRWLSLRG